MCAKKEIGILIILRSNQKILEKLEALIPDKTVHIYARQQEDSYVVETVLASGRKLPVFSIRLSGTNIDSAQKEKEEILLAVKDRKDIAPKNQSGISNEFLDNMKGK